MSAMDFDKPPNMGLMVLIGVGTLLVLGTCCLCSAALVPYLQRAGLIHMK